MSLIKWNDDYSVGNDVLDGHHKKLFSLMEDTFNLITKDEINDQLLEILSEIKSYTEFHFKAEEDRMIASNYPLYQDHKEEHDNLIKKLDGVVATYEESSRDSLEDLFMLLNQWLVNHIMNEDMRYKDKI